MSAMSMTSNGQLLDVVGAGERGRVVTDGRDVQGSLLVSAKNLDITGGGIIAPTQGNRIGSRIELHADQLNTRPGTGPGGTLTAPRILDATDPTRVVISSSSTGSGGAGSISMTGESVPMPEGTPFPPASSIHLSGTNVLTDTRSDALGGKIELKASGPIQLNNTTISSNVNDVRPQSANVTDQGGNIALSAGTLVMQGSGISALSGGTQNGGNVAIAAQESITLGAGSTISVSNTGSANAGNITINAGSQFLSQNASVTAQASQGSGGNINLQAIDSIRLINSQINTSVQGGPDTSGGNITIDPTFMTLQNSQILAQAVQGQGGNINIVAGTFLADQTSVVSASSAIRVERRREYPVPPVHVERDPGHAPATPAASPTPLAATLRGPGKRPTEQPGRGGTRYAAVGARRLADEFPGAAHRRCSCLPTQPSHQ